MDNLDDPARHHLLSANLSDKRVLVVDRHPAARDALRMMLSNLGITKVVGAGSSHEVLRLARSASFDIILSDYMLDDGRDGQQLIEELRQQRLVPLATVFMVITSERGYHNVVGVAELTPDDYLVKPFTIEQLQTRLGKALYRKEQLSGIYHSLDAGAYSAALSACDVAIEKGDEFFLDLMRLKGDLLNTLGRHGEAEALYREILAARPLPWASRGLARTLKSLGKLAEAEEIARALVKEHRHFLVAHDFLAGVLESSGRMIDAQTVLSDAIAISPCSTSKAGRRNGASSTCSRHNRRRRRIRASSAPTTCSRALPTRTGFRLLPCDSRLPTP